MGATHVTVAVVHPSDSQKRWEGLFLVDTGSIDCMAPAKALDSIGIRRRTKRTCELADGTEISFDVGTAEVEFTGEAVGVNIIFGGDETEPILGRAALASAGIEFDSRGHMLRRRAVRLKATA